MFEPSLSMSAMRPPTNAPSMADSLPNINFGFDDLRDRMARFTEKFDKFIDAGRKRVLEERNHFHMNVAQLQGMRVDWLEENHWRCSLTQSIRGPTSQEEGNRVPEPESLKPCSSRRQRSRRNCGDARCDCLNLTTARRPRSTPRPHTRRNRSSPKTHCATAISAATTCK